MEQKKSTIIVSAYDDMNNIRCAMNRGAFDFLTKPINFDDLETTLEKTIRHVNMLRDSHQRLIKAELAQASLAGGEGDTDHLRRDAERIHVRNDRNCIRA
jgi:YesN/AraC family two-component response regulator